MGLLRRPASLVIPLATPEYEQRAAERHNNVLRLFFGQLDAFFTALVGVRGGQYLNTPYGSFSSRVDQTAAAINTPYVVTIGTTDMSNGISVTSNKVTVAQSGIYNVQFSMQLENTDAQIQEVDVWFRKNGSDVAYSNTRYGVHSSHGGVHGYSVAALDFYFDMDAEDYLELVWATASTQVSIKAIAPQVSPFVHPGIPAVVLTAAFLSAKTE